MQKYLDLTLKRSVVLAAILLLSSLAACQVSTTQTGPAAQPKAAYTQVSVQELRHMLAAGKDFPLINVHVPYEGEIEQTDAFIPYNEIAQHTDQLPADKNAKIVLYCRSGRMSAEAAQKLADLGYKNVIDVKGGMVAWQQAGYELLDK